MSVYTKIKHKEIKLNINLICVWLAVKVMWSETKNVILKENNAGGVATNLMQSGSQTIYLFHDNDELGRLQK